MKVGFDAPQSYGNVQRIKKRYFIRTKKKSGFNQFKGELRQIAKSLPEPQLLTAQQIQLIQARQRAQQQLLQQPPQPFESSGKESPSRNFFEHYNENVHDDGDGYLLKFFDSNKIRGKGGTGSCFGLY